MEPFSLLVIVSLVGPGVCLALGELILKAQVQAPKNGPVGPATTSVR